MVFGVITTLLFVLFKGISVINFIRIAIAQGVGWSIEGIEVKG